jgi:hypothetical protein
LIKNHIFRAIAKFGMGLNKDCPEKGKKSGII